MLRCQVDESLMKCYDEWLWCLCWWYDVMWFMIRCYVNYDMMICDVLWIYLWWYMMTLCLYLGCYKMMFIIMLTYEVDYDFDYEVVFDNVMFWWWSICELHDDVYDW
jgi:hypothetical protein